MRLSNKFPILYFFIIQAVKFFNGQSFMRFETPLRMIGKLTHIEFDIRPLKENGILLYSDDPGIKDFIAVVLNNSYVEFRLVGIPNSL